MKGYADIADLPEDERITLIGQRAETGERVGFFVEDDAKADRYMTKLQTQFQVQEVKRSHGFPANTVLVIVTRLANAQEH